MASIVGKSTSNATRMHIPRGDVFALWLGIAFSALFTGIIWLTGDALKAFPHLPDQGASWYFWKLPAPTLMSEITSWSFYALHQVIVWGLIWYAQTHVKKYTSGLHPINMVALGVNAFFILLHFVQTHIWYDGLAQNVSIFSSQGSVIVLLIWVLLMENNRRGLLFGKNCLYRSGWYNLRANTTATSFRGRLFIPSGIIRWKIPPVTW